MYSIPDFAYFLSFFARKTTKKEAYASSRLTRRTRFFSLSFSAPQFISVCSAVLASLPPKNTLAYSCVSHTHQTYAPKSHQTYLPSSSLLSPGSSPIASHLFLQASSLIFPWHSFTHLSLALLFHLFHPSVSSRERHTPRLRRVLSAPCGASNSGTDFFLAGFHPSTPSLPDALKAIAAAYSFPRYGRGIVAAA